jgi:hypothetical protein
MSSSADKQLASSSTSGSGGASSSTSVAKNLISKHHHKSKKGLAKRAKSFKEDFLEKINQTIGRSSSSTPGSTNTSATTVSSSLNLLGADLVLKRSSQGRNHSISSLTPARDQEEAEKREKKKDRIFIQKEGLSSPTKSSCGSSSHLPSIVPSSPPSVSSLIPKDLTNAYNFVKRLNSSLRYLTDVVEKDKLEQLPGAASVLLEIVVSGYAELRPHLSCQKQRLVNSQHSFRGSFVSKSNQQLQVILISL